MPMEIRTPGDVSPILKTISDKHGFTQSADGTCLFYRFWTPPAGTSPESVVLMLHGIGEHSGSYEGVANEMNKPGIVFYALDMRGHGLSCGKRDHVPTSVTETGDISTMLAIIRQTYPQAKVFLMAESMGTAFAIDFAKENIADLSGMILVSPVVAVSSGQWRQWGTFRYLPDLLFRPNKPVISLSGRGRSPSTQSAQPAAPNSDDPLTYHKVSVNYVLEVRRAELHWEDAAPLIHIPTLILEGQLDPVVKPGSINHLFDLLGTKDKDLKTYPNAQHSLLRKPPTPDILNSVSDWIVGH